MTLEELKKEAKKHGYYVMRPSTKYTKFLKCTCGYNRRTELYNSKEGVAYECKKCGLRSEFRPKAEWARQAWNEMIERNTNANKQR